MTRPARAAPDHRAYARDGGPHRLAVLLAALTFLEQAVGRSGRAKENAPVPYAPPAGKFLGVLTQDEYMDSPELRVAVGLASCQTRPGADPSQVPSRTMRQLLLPIDPGDRSQPNGRWRDFPVIPGFGSRPLPDVLADVLVWRCRTAADEFGSERFWGAPAFRSGIRVPADDLHRFASGELDEQKLNLLFRACLALSWRNVSYQWLAAAPRAPVPTLGVLQPLANGLRPGTGLRRGSELPSVAGEGEEAELALNPDWAMQLTAGRVAKVHEDALARLRQAGWDAVPAPPVFPDGTRIAAALVPRCLRPGTVLSAIATKIKTSDSEEQS